MQKYLMRFLLFTLFVCLGLVHCGHEEETGKVSIEKRENQEAASLQSFSSYLDQSLEKAKVFSVEPSCKKNSYDHPNPKKRCFDPKNKIQQAIEQAKGHQQKTKEAVIVEVNGGKWNCPSFLSIENIGASKEAPFVIRATTGTRPQIQGCKYEAVRINRSHHVILEGFEFANNRRDDIFFKEDEASHITIQKCWFIGSGSGRRAITFSKYANAPAIKIINNIFLGKGTAAVSLGPKGKTELLFAHNLLYQVQTGLFFDAQREKRKGVQRITNNIFHLEGVNASAYTFAIHPYPSFLADHNIYVLKNNAFLSKRSGKNYKDSNFHEWKTKEFGFEVDANSTLQNTDLLFKDPSSLDFHITNASSLSYRRGKFLQILEDLEGNPRHDPPDIGPFELMPKRMMTGVAFKKALSKGRVEVRILNKDGTLGVILGTTETDEKGTFEIAIPEEYLGPVIVQVIRGTYQDEITGETIIIEQMKIKPSMTIDIKKSEEGLKDLLITPVTTAAADMAISTAKMGGDLVRAIEDLKTKDGSYFGVEVSGEEEKEIYIEDLFDWPGLTEEQKNRKAVTDWLTLHRFYGKEDRKEILEMALLALRVRGERALSEIEAALKTLVVSQEKERESLMMVLGEIGADLVVSKDPGALDYEKNVIQMFKGEIEKHESEIPKEELEKVDRSHDPGIVERDGKLFQNHSLTKLTAIKALKTMGDDLAKEALREVINTADYPNYIKEEAKQSLLAISQ